MSRAFRNSGRISSTPGTLPPGNYFSNLCHSDGIAFLHVFRLCLLQGGHSEQIERILKVLLSLPDDVLSPGLCFCKHRSCSPSGHLVPVAASGVPKDNHALKDSFFSLTASITADVHQ
ncbi:hypothetical protein CRENBAI_002738 [Crenichthys baileyi]|uniref:Uncharacterized protein n=1 Tax=Crenichthys baileyi TaxID=28760 RepID=A0AAV9SQW8_9TELE